MGCHQLAHQVCREENRMSSNVEVDFYQWMSGHGENKITTKSERGKFYIRVEFDGKEGLEEEKTLAFNSVSYFSVGSFPGVAGMENHYQFDYEFSSGKLLKVSDSGFSSEWRKYWEKSGSITNKTYNHYLIFFTSENKVIHVIANGFSIQ